MLFYLALPTVRYNVYLQVCKGVYLSNGCTQLHTYRGQQYLGKLGHFQNQRSTVWIQSSAQFYLNQSFVNCWKDENKKEAGIGQLKM